MSTDDNAVQSGLLKALQTAIAANAHAQAEATAAFTSGRTDLLSGFLAAFLPSKEEIKTAATSLAAIQEHWTHQADELRQQSTRIAKALEENAPRMRRALENAAEVGQLGWTANMDMVPMDVVRLSEMESRSEADKYMVSWYDVNDRDQTGLETYLIGQQELEPFRTVLTQSFSAYRRGEYAITIPSLTAVVEAAIRTLAPSHPQFFRTDVKNIVEHRSRKVGNESVVAVIWLTLSGFIQLFYEQYRPADVGTGRVFRHGLQHGTQVPPNDRTEVLRLLNVLNTIAGLCWDRC